MTYQREFPIRARTVYFLQQEGFPESPVKIGSSVNVESRIETMDHWSPYPLTMITGFMGDWNVERNIHYLFRHDHMRREWFEWSPALAEFLAFTNSPDFDPFSLEQCPTGFRMCGKRLGWSERLEERERAA